MATYTYTWAPSEPSAPSVTLLGCGRLATDRVPLAGLRGDERGAELREREHEGDLRPRLRTT